jgi:hypothetical protein
MDQDHGMFFLIVGVCVLGIISLSVIGAGMARRRERRGDDREDHPVIPTPDLDDDHPLI